MNSRNQLGNGQDKDRGPAPANGFTIPGENSFNKPAAEPVTAPKPNGWPGLVVPEIDPSVIWHFSLAGQEAKDAAFQYAEQAWSAVNRSPCTHDHLRDLLMRDAEETLNRITAEGRAHEIFHVAVSADQSGVGLDRHLRAMLWLAYAFIGIGLVVVNFTLSSYLLGSGILDFALYPWKAYFFCSLPLTAALTLKALTMWMTERSRRRYALILGATGSVIAMIAWAAAFAWLFSPQSAGTLTLPGDGGGIDIDKIIRFGLVFSHIVGETCCAAALGLWAHRLAHRNARMEAHTTEEFEICRELHGEIATELKGLQARQFEEFDYQRRFEAGMLAFKADVGSRFDAELKKREAAAAAAAAKLLSAPGY